MVMLAGRSRPARWIAAAAALLAALSTMVPGVAAGAAPPEQTRLERLESLRTVARHRGAVAVIVRFADGSTPGVELPAAAAQQRLDRIRAIGERIVNDASVLGRVDNVKRMKHTPHVAVTVDEHALTGLGHHPDVLEIAEDKLSAPQLEQSVPLIGASTFAWSSGWTGSGQTVAILDTGVDRTHPFLAGKVVSEACYSTTNSFYASTSVCPGGQDSVAPGSGVNCSVGGCSHGTHVAGIAAGRDPGGAGRNGVARDATVIAIQVFSRFDSSAQCGGTAPCVMSYDSDQMAGLDRVYDLRNSYRIAAANLSLGGGRYYSSCDYEPVKASIDLLRAAGIATVISSGNESYRDSLSGPACVSSAISVGSTCDSANYYCTGTDAVAEYSNVAPFVSLLAPGSAITASVPGGGYATWHGTSMAAPHVTGAWALKKQQSSSASVDSVLADFRSSGVTMNDTRSGGTTTGLKRIRFAGTSTYTLSIANGGNGTVTSSPAGIACGTACSATFAAGTAVTLTAAPATGYAFGGWGGVCSGTGSCVVSMQGNASVSATFNRTATEAPGVNVALAANGGVASASSSYSASFPVSAVNDNERAGRGWGSGGGWNDGTFAAYPDWVRIDFSGAKTINRAVVYTLQDNWGNPVEPTDTTTFTTYGITDFTVQALVGSSWMTVATVTGNNLVKRAVTFGAVTATAIRVNVNRSLNNWARITEIEAWGY